MTQNQRIILVGAVHLDKQAHCINEYVARASNPVTTTTSVGGVAYNMATMITLLAKRQKTMPPALVSIAGNDALARDIIKQTTRFELDFIQLISDSDKPTGQYTALFDKDGELVTGLADMELYAEFSWDLLKAAFVQAARDACFLVLDANLPVATLKHSCDFACSHHLKLAIAPVSPVKALKLKPYLAQQDLLVVNQREAHALSGLETTNPQKAIEIYDHFKEKGVKRLVLTLGDKGVIVFDTEQAWHLPPVKNIRIANVNGAGDGFTGALIWAVSQGKPLIEAAKLAHAAALQIMENSAANLKSLDFKKLQQDDIQIEALNLFRS